MKNLLKLVIICFVCQCGTDSKNDDSEKPGAEKDKSESWKNYTDKIIIGGLVCKLDENEKSADWQINFTNNGDKTIKILWMTVSFQNETGKTISEEKAPVINKFTQPLKPGLEVAMIGSLEWYSYSGISPKWKPGSCSGEVSGIEFMGVGD